MIGEGLAAHVGNVTLLREHGDSPKTYQRDYEQAKYRFYDVSWRSIAPHAAGVAADLDGAPISRVRPL